MTTDEQIPAVYTLSASERSTLRGVCEGAVAASQGKPCPPVILLPVSAVLALLDASEPRNAP